MFGKIRSWFNTKAVREMARTKALDALHEVADYAAARAVVYAPIDTGFMAQHIRVETLHDGLGFRVVSSAFYSVYVHRWMPFLAMGMADAAAIWPTVAQAQTMAGGIHNPEGFLSATFTT